MDLDNGFVLQEAIVQYIRQQQNPVSMDPECDHTP